METHQDFCTPRAEKTPQVPRNQPSCIFYFSGGDMAAEINFVVLSRRSPTTWIEDLTQPLSFPTFGRYLHDGSNWKIDVTPVFELPYQSNPIIPLRPPISGKSGKVLSETRSIAALLKALRSPPPIQSLLRQRALVIQGAWLLYTLMILH